MKQYLPFLFLCLLVGCVVVQRPAIKFSSLPPNPSDTNLQSTNYFNPQPRTSIVDSNQIYSRMVLANGGQVHLLVYNMIPGHFYRVFWANNSVPATPMPNKTNSFGWGLFFDFTTAISNIDYDTKINVKTNPSTYWWTRDDATP